MPRLSPAVSRALVVAAAGILSITGTAVSASASPAKASPAALHWEIVGYAKTEVVCENYYYKYYWPQAVDHECLVSTTQPGWWDIWVAYPQ